jgi:hypothetical protein
MYDDLHTYGPPGSWKFPKEKKAKAAAAAAPAAKKALMQVWRQDTYDKDPDTVSMYDDLHTYVKPGTGAFAQKLDTYDKDPDTVSMYDDLHTYVKPGTGAFAQKLDNYDHDPNTVSEYDDPHKRSTPAWILNGGVVRKAGKKAKKSKSKGKKSKSKGKGKGKGKKSKSKGKKNKKSKKAKKALMQVGHNDTFDKDPDTVSMYDDLHTYVKPGTGAFA